MITEALASLTGICLILQIIGVMYGIKYNTWKEKDTPKSVTILLILTSSFYVFSVLLVFVFYIMVNVFAFNGPDDMPFIAKIILYLFLFCYLISQLLTIALWINRLEITFQTSIYAYSKYKIKALKVGLFCIVIIGVLIVSLNIIADMYRSEWLRILNRYFTILWGVFFISELGTLILAFIVKLVQLRRAAEMQINITSDDPESLKVIQQLIGLQSKLTILAVATIISTFISIVFTTVILSGYIGVLPLAIDSFIGFICIFCVIKQHEMVFKKVCIACIECCHLCINEELYDNIEPEYSIYTHTKSKAVDVESGVDVKSQIDTETNKDIQLPTINPQMKLRVASFESQMSSHADFTPMSAPSANEDIEGDLRIPSTRTDAFPDV